VLFSVGMAGRSVVTVNTPRDIIDGISVEESRLRRAREEVTARPIAYPFGSGQAEEIALLAGLKPILRQSFLPDQIASARARFAALGLVVVEAEWPYKPPERLLLVGHKEEELRETLRAELNHDVATAGRLLGYPACCVEAFASTFDRRRIPLLHAAALRRTVGRPRARLNVLDLAVFHYLPWLPCSFSCEPSTRFADEIASLIRVKHSAATGRRDDHPQECRDGACIHSRFIDQVDAALAAIRLLVLDRVQLSIEGQLRDGAVEITRAWATARDRHPRALLDAEAAESVARLLAVVAQAQTVSVDGDALLLDEGVLLRSSELALVPFAA